MKAKILKVSEMSATIGFSDGTFKDIPLQELGFVPNGGDEIDFYVQGDKTVYVQNSGFAATKRNDGKKAVNKVTYILLSVFPPVSSFGLQHFYAGRGWAGALSVMFCWVAIPQIVGIIEGISALFQKSDSDGKILVKGSDARMWPYVLLSLLGIAIEVVIALTILYIFSDPKS